MSSAQPTTARPHLGLILISLARADFTALVKNPRRLLLSFLLPILLLLITNSTKGTQHLGGALFVIGLSIAYGLASTSIMGYALSIARDRENAVFQRLRVTPAPTWTIMASRLAMQVLANLVIALVVVIVGAQTMFRFRPVNTPSCSRSRSSAVRCSLPSARRLSVS